MNRLIRCAAPLLAVLGSIPVASAATILNASFELPITSGFIYNPVDPTGGWTFSGRSGVASNAFFVPPPPDGSQAAFLQQAGDQFSSLSSISQTLSGVTLVPSTLSFYIALRPGGFTANPIVVTYAGQNLGTFTPASTNFTLVTINFTPTATTGALVFHSAAGTTGDLDTALDFVSLSSVPEPGTFLTIAPALAALALLRRRLVVRNATVAPRL